MLPRPPLTRVRPTSNRVSSAAAIAVVSEVNPDKPGAFRYFWLLVSSLLLLLLASQSHAIPAFHARTAMNNAIYQNALVDVTPMLFHHIELNMSYAAVIKTVGKHPLYCDSGESACNAHNGDLSSSCVEAEFIKPHKAWMCHWDGSRQGSDKPSNLQVYFSGDRVTTISATMPNGMTYRRDAANSVHLDKSHG